MQNRFARPDGGVLLLNGSQSGSSPILTNQKNLDLYGEIDSIIAGADLFGVIHHLLTHSSLPETLVYGCTDYRIPLSELLNLDPGVAFIQKQVGGFIAKNLADARGMHASVSVATGLKKVKKIILMSHSDCAAAKVAVSYPKIGDIPETVDNFRVLQVIQDYVLRVHSEMPRLAWMFKQVAARSNYAIPAEDFAAAALGVVSYRTLLNTRLYDNMTKTVGEVVAEGNVAVVQTHFDLGKVDVPGKPTKFLRLPALYRYDPDTNQFKLALKLSEDQAYALIDQLWGPHGLPCSCGYEHLNGEENPLDPETHMPSLLTRGLVNDNDHCNNVIGFDGRRYSSQGCGSLLAPALV